MNAGILPLLLLGFSVGLMLAFAPRRATMTALSAFVAATLIGYSISTSAPSPAVFAGVWITTIVVAATTYLSMQQSVPVPLVLSALAGLVLGACAGLTGDHRGLLAGSLLALICYPAKALVARKLDIVIKVVASWMIAIASLSMFVSLMATPGYKPDHME